MARNRKRRSDRRPGRPADGRESPPGVATARGARPDESQDPLQHAAPDVELAEAQLALGRPELAGEGEFTEAELTEAELADDDFGAGGDDFDSGGGAGGGGGSGAGRSGGGRQRAEGGAVALSAPSAHKQWAGARMVGFLQGSWRELQRVQWPDRRQVMQATGVVIGFVIVAGVFLGVADFVATKVVNLILK